MAANNDPDQSLPPDLTQLPLNERLAFKPDLVQNNQHFQGNSVEVLIRGKLIQAGNFPCVRKIHKSQNPLFIEAFCTQIKFLNGSHPQLKLFSHYSPGCAYGQPSLDPYFPRVISCRTTDKNSCSTIDNPSLFYDMPFYNPEDGWLNGDEFIKSVDSELKIKRFINLLNHQLDQIHTVSSPSKKLRKQYIYKMMSKFKNIIHLLGQDKIIQKLESFPQIRFNNQPLQPLAKIASLITQGPHAYEFWDRLTPPKISLLNGDLYLANLLYNPRKNQLIFIDVGHVWNLFMGDPVFDRAKFEDSLSGRLALMKRGFFDLKIKGSQIAFALNWEKLPYSKTARQLLKSNSPLLQAVFPGPLADEPLLKIRKAVADAFYALGVAPILQDKFKSARYCLGLNYLNQGINSYKLLT
jgi:hypothetical protein